MNSGNSEMKNGGYTLTDVWRRWGAQIERLRPGGRLSPIADGGRYRRPLSPVERIWLAVESRGCVVIAIVLEGPAEGALDVEALRRAADAASSANPAARVTLRGWLSQAEWVDSERPVPVRVADVGDWDGRSPEGAPCLAEPLDARRGPVCEVVLLRGTRSRIAIRAHHAAMDGMGLSFFAEDLFRALRGETPVGSRDCTVDLDVARDMGRGKFGGFPRPGLSLTGSATRGLEGATWRRRRVEARSARFIPQVCAALTNAALEERKGRVTFTVAVDMRGRRAGLRTLGNMFGVIELVFDEKLDARAAYRAMLGRLKDRGEGGYLQDMALVRHLPIGLLEYSVRRGVERARQTDQPIPSCGISYIEADLNRMSGGGFSPVTAFGMPPVVDSIGCLVDAVATGSGTDILVAMPRALGDGGRLERILDIVCNAITAS